ncbi:hypothetical protein EUGRSUZ_E03544 [Eucalyptus grandis]|uniref:Uncharacterized protein n=2 Tax=Eucalyptus grandis TaxID=71139 RepID=A0ACC3LDD4_EUCGR|nr:hypothetical protein EUGRSUZ_E03544 [Eucalyptus grandis]
MKPFHCSFSVINPKTSPSVACFLQRSPKIRFPGTQSVAHRNRALLHICKGRRVLSPLSYFTVLFLFKFMCTVS